MCGELIARFDAISGGFTVRLYHGHGFSRVKDKIRSLRNLQSVQELVKLKTGDGWRISLCENYDEPRADAVLAITVGVLADEGFQIAYTISALPVTKHVLLKQIMNA